MSPEDKESIDSLSLEDLLFGIDILPHVDIHDDEYKQYWIARYHQLKAEESIIKSRPDDLDRNLEPEI